MKPIRLSQFADYILTAGAGKVAQIKAIKQDHDERFSDFYRPVREAIVDMHTKGLDTIVLDDLLASLVDPRERRIFPKVVEGYKKFLRSGRITWFEPPMRDYPLGPISVHTAPELGLLIDEKPHAIKMYLRGDPISPERIQIINHLLASAMGTAWPGTTFAVLDVRRARLYPCRPKSETGLLLKAEALSFESLWSAL